MSLKVNIKKIDNNEFNDNLEKILMILVKLELARLKKIQDVHNNFFTDHIKQLHLKPTVYLQIEKKKI